MNHRILILALALALPLAGCKQVNVPLPAWAPTANVAAAGYTIAAANAAVVQFESDEAAGFVPSPTFKAVMSDIQQGLAVSQPIFDQWEAAARLNATAPEPAALPTQITRLTSDLAKLPAATGN
jgi:hypothetical protein